MESTRGLWQGLGCPEWDSDIPPARARAWVTAISHLGETIGCQGAILGRGPSWVWDRFQPPGARRNPKWADLCRGWEDATVSQLQGAILGPRAHAPLSITSWNARWLVGHNSLVTLKLNCIEERLLAGHSVCVYRKRIGTRKTLRFIRSRSRYGFGMLLTRSIFTTQVLMGATGALRPSCHPEWSSVRIGS